MNVKEELIIAVMGITIICAELSIDNDIFGLKVGYTTEELEYFLDKLDFNYDAGYGIQNLYGIVWLSDNKWLERYEYDGSERWVCKSRPTIPEELK